ncbi:MAG TPA: phytanoyl-CoA dioxygenase family protein, partial [Stenomitos sp.]
MVLSEEQLALLPTEEDVAFYEAHGWYVSPKIIPDEVFEVAKLGAERFYRGERDAEWPYTSGFSVSNPEHPNAIRNDQYVAFRIQELRYLALQPVIGAIAARLARTTEIRLLDDALVYKPPQSKGVVGWHVDRAYWGNCTSDNMLTAWIPFHDVDESHGPLMVCDRSHRWRGMEHSRQFNNQDIDGV